MKKLVFSALAVCALALTFSSCKSTSYTATRVIVPTVVSSANVADLEVGNRSTYRYTTTAADRKGGLNNCKNAAITAFLKQNGNADVIVAPEFVHDGDMNYVEVTGRPASYKNFRGAN